MDWVEAWAAFLSAPLSSQLCVFISLTATLTFVGWPFKILHRYVRHLDIEKQGWPPPHIDADGDWKSDES